MIIIIQRTTPNGSRSAVNNGNRKTMGTCRTTSYGGNVDGRVSNEYERCLPAHWYGGVSVYGQRVAVLANIAT